MRPECREFLDELYRRVRERANLHLEGKGRLNPYWRLIIVCGMAHTGTSALASYIGSHPKVKLVVGNPMWYKAESDIIRDSIDWDTIDALLRENRNFRVLLKQPWVESNGSFVRALREAKFVVCFREVKPLYRSWSGSQDVPYEAKEFSHREIFYAKNIKCCEDVVKRGGLRVDKEKMGPELAAVLGRYLDLDPAGFDAARIQKKWLQAGEKEWLKQHAIWRDKNV